MSEEVIKDETIDFVSTSSDLPAGNAEAIEPPKAEEQASSEVKEDIVESDSIDDPKEGDSADKSGDKLDASNDTEVIEKVKKPNNAQKRINKIVKEREDAKRETEKLKKEIKELKSPDSLGNEPVEKDFSTYDEYLDALDAHERKGGSKAAKDKAEDSKVDVVKDSSPGLSDSQKTALGVIEEIVKGTENLPDDFKKITLNEKLSITGEMLEALAECDDPAKIMYHLGNNTDDAKEIASLSPAQQMREIAKLDLNIKVKPQKPKQKTKAAEPIIPVKASESQKKPVSKMTFSEYEAHRNEQARARAKTGGW